MTSRVILLFPLVLLLGLAGCKETGEIVDPPPGPAWVTMKRPDTPQLLDNKINELAVDGSGRVWIATDSGANSFFKNTWGRFRDSLGFTIYNPERTSYKVNHIEPGMSGAIWFGLDGGGVRRYREGASRRIWQSYWQPDLTQNVVQSIAADLVVNGDVWVATTFGVSRFIPSQSDPEIGTWRQYYMPDLPNNQIYCSAVNYNDNTVWFGTANGLGMYDDRITDWAEYQIPDPYNFRILSIDFDLQGRVFLGKLEGASVYDRNESEYTHYTSGTTGGMLPAGPVNSVASDHAGSVWFGTDAGLAHLRDTVWTIYTTANSPFLPSNRIRAVVIDRRDNLWIGTDLGIAVYNELGTRF